MITRGLVPALLAGTLAAWGCSDNGSPVQPGGNPHKPQIQTLAASMDNSLYSESDTLSNGAGADLIVGVTGTQSNPDHLIRRALIAFPVSARIPAGAVVDSVHLDLFVSRTAPLRKPSPVRIRRVSRSWGEAASSADGTPGRGAKAQSGDATWGFTFYDTARWVMVGGDFAPDTTASAVIDAAGKYYRWGATDRMTADVQGWLDAPATNFGWILVADESETWNAIRLNSRQNATNSPRLTVYFHQ